MGRAAPGGGSGVGRVAALRVLELAGIAGDVRPEELALAEFAALSRAFVAERYAQPSDATTSTRAQEGGRRAGAS